MGLLYFNMFKWINNNFNKTANISTYRHNPEKNPDNFETRNIAAEILELQFQCESQSSSTQLIASLTDLYTQAVTYYESINDKRYRLYQKRLECFLKKQNIDDILRGKSGHLASKKELTEKELIGARIKSRGEVAQIIERSERLQKINRSKITKNLSEQQHQLSRRIQKRRVMSNCSTRTKDEDDDGQQLNLNAKQIDKDILLGEFLLLKDEKRKRVFI